MPCVLIEAHRLGQIKLNNKWDAHITLPIIPKRSLKSIPFIPCDFDEISLPVMKEMISTES